MLHASHCDIMQNKFDVYITDILPWKFTFQALNTQPQMKQRIAYLLY